MTVSANHDDQVMAEMPRDYWLKGEKMKLLLACMVHCGNKQIAAQCSLLAAGQMR